MLTNIGVSKNMWQRGSAGISNVTKQGISRQGLVLFAPLWHPNLQGSPFNAWDISNNSVHSCTVTEATWGTTGRTFDGTDDKITVPDNAAFDSATALSVFAWIKVDVNDESNYIAGKYLSSGDEREWFLRHDSQKLRIYFGDPNDGSFEGGLLTDDDLLASTSTYYFVGFTFSAGTVLVYVDGASKAFTVDTGAVPSSLYNGSADLIIGWYGNENAGTSFDGVIGDFIIYNRVLSSSEITNTYNLTKWRYA